MTLQLMLSVVDVMVNIPQVNAGSRMLNVMPVGSKVTFPEPVEVNIGVNNHKKENNLNLIIHDIYLNRKRRVILRIQVQFEQVQFSEWATPTVPVVKPDGSVRVCGDYKLTVNTVSKLDAYPIPKLDDLYTKLAGGKTFTELDLSHAYEQMLVDEDSKEIMTINTHKGLFRYNRLPYGVSSAPGIFQRTMEGLLQGIPHVGVLLDNILITGVTDEEHLENIETVLKCLLDAAYDLNAVSASL